MTWTNISFSLVILNYFFNKSAKVKFSNSKETTDTILTSRISTFELPDVISYTTLPQEVKVVISDRLRTAKDTDYSENTLSDNMDLNWKR